MTTSRSRSAAVLLLWLTFLGGTVASLHAVGGALAPPPLTNLGGMSGWMEERQPAEAAFALLRLVALGTGWYLLGATVASTLARLIRVPVLVRFVDGLTVPAVRELLNAVAGVSLATATLTTGASVAMTVHDRSGHRPPVTVTAVAGATSDPTGVAPGPDPAGEGAGAERGEGGADPKGVTDPGEVSRSSQIGGELPPAPAVVGRPPRQVGETTPPAETGPPEHPPAPAPPTLRRLPDDPGAQAPDPSSTQRVPAPPAPSAPPASPEPPAPPLEVQPARWEIRAGQHLWAVAEAVLSSAWQRPPTDAEVDPYWRHLVETNRSILRDRSNPDLVYPGQVLTIPPPPAAPSAS